MNQIQNTCACFNNRFLRLSSENKRRIKMFKPYIKGLYFCCCAYCTNMLHFYLKIRFMKPHVYCLLVLPNKPLSSTELLSTLVLGIVAKFRFCEWINFYSPWNHQKTTVVMMISGEQNLINSLKYTNIRSEIWRQCLRDVQQINSPKCFITCSFLPSWKVIST